MRYYYDLHIHSDLSPCGDVDMTPNNIVNMAYIKGLNIISVTDHNAYHNLKAVEIVCKRIGINLIYGMEVTTYEGIHILCYFGKYDDIEKFGEIVYDSLPNIKNNPDFYGQQNIYDENDIIIGTIQKMLLSSTNITIDNLVELVYKYNGICVPAHINKTNNGLLGVLGFFPSNIDFRYIEIQKCRQNDMTIISKFNKYKILFNSDAHFLKDISEPEHFFERQNNINFNNLFI